MKIVKLRCHKRKNSLTENLDEALEHMYILCDDKANHQFSKYSLRFQ